MDLPVGPWPSGCRPEPLSAGAGAPTGTSTPPPGPSPTPNPPKSSSPRCEPPSTPTPRIGPVIVRWNTQSMYTAASTMPNVATVAQAGYTVKVPINTRNSEMNELVPGIAIVANDAIRNIPPRIGATFQTPP